jgi:hypothetical protein
VRGKKKWVGGGGRSCGKKEKKMKKDREMKSKKEERENIFV